MQWVETNIMMIPAGEPDAVHSCPTGTSRADPTEFASFITGQRIANNVPITIYSSSLHMHNLGTRATVSIERSGGGTECLVDIPRWDF